MLSPDDEIINEFIKETREHLETIEADLLTIENMGDAFDDELVNKVFRAAHSIKGGSGFFGLDKVKELAHRTESVLDLLRSRQITVNAEVINILLESFDCLRSMMTNPAESHLFDIDPLVSGLVSLAVSYLPADKKETVTSSEVLQGPPGLGTVNISSLIMDRIRNSGQSIYWLEGDLIHDLEKAGRNILHFFNQLLELGEVLDFLIDYDAVGTLDGEIGNRLPLKMIIASALTPAKIEQELGIAFASRLHLLHVSDDVVVESPAAEEIPVEQPVPSANEEPAASVAVAPPAQDRSPGKAALSRVEDTLRVNVSLLDTLMNLAGELVLSRNQLRTAVAQEQRESLIKANQRINQITSELQDVIMHTRLQPIDIVFSKFPRVVRDLSRDLGKEVELDLHGKDVALDKTIIEGLSDPLTHMVRNAVDHGFETRAERLQQGKPAIGTLKIEARYEAGLVVLEVADDGKGIDGNKVAAAAIKKGKISEEKVATLSDREKQALVFLPGLSTVSEVSDVSGRGVGMDVVKNNLNQLGGQVEIHSEVGKGSLFRIKLPLTLAIIPALIVDAGVERFAIPQANIEELLRLRSSDVKNRIEVVGDSDVLILRERVLPLARLSDVIGVLPTYRDPVSGKIEVDRRARISDRRSPEYAFNESAGETPEDSPDIHEGRQRTDRRTARNSVLEIVVVTTGNLSYGLVVDKFHDTEEIVVKPLGRRFKKLGEYSGAAILGDGNIALILDMDGLAGKAGLDSVEASARARDVAAAARSDAAVQNRSLLVFNNGPVEPCAISLDLVQRIEKIGKAQIEYLGKKRTMQYRGGSLPLICLSDAAQAASVEEMDNMVVLVTVVHGHEVGLLGSLPIDIVETDAEADTSTHRQTGVAGSLVLQGSTSLLVDVREIVDVLYPDWIDSESGSSLNASGITDTRKSLVVLAEDSDFFRNQIHSFLEESGFAVLAAADGEAAWQLIRQHVQDIAVVVTDIEMPLLSGYELTERIRKEQDTAALPVIAVTALAGDGDIEKGKSIGINEYQIKMDRDKLVGSIRQLIQDRNRAKE